jgi:hypothetical protein
LLTSKYGFSVVAAGLLPLAGALDHLAHLGAARVDGGELLEGGLGVLGGQPRERRLARAGRPEQHHRVRVAGLERRAQRRALPEQVLLADVVREQARAHPRGERPARGRRSDPGVLGRLVGGIEQALHIGTA